MAEDEKPAEKPALPGNHGQFGTNVATEDSQVLEDHKTPSAPGTQGPNQTGAGERS